MDANAATIIAAVIGAAATVLAAVFGYRQWARDRTSQKSARFDADRHEIYKSLWDRVEQVNAALRREKVDEAGFQEMVADLNEYILRNGVHVDEADYKLANEYVAAVKTFHRVVSKLDPEDQVAYGRTEMLPRSVVSKAAEVGRAHSEVSRLRQQLREKVRAMLGAEPE
jgi:hypothetical protein